MHGSYACHVWHTPRPHSWHQAVSGALTAREQLQFYSYIHSYTAASLQLHTYLVEQGLAGPGAACGSGAAHRQPLGLGSAWAPAP